MSVEIPTIKEKREAKDPSIAELEKPLRRVLSEIQDHIDYGEYGLIIGDDSSGRLPTLILGRVIREIYKKKDYPPIDIIFLASGGRRLYEEDEIKKQAETMKQYLLTKGIDKLEWR